jgi:hypothetical protein
MTDWKVRQNRDGGWAYSGRGRSWTEPTAYVLLAQTATQIDRPGFEAGIRFLRATQRPDGGWSPQPGVAESTWVTAVVALLPEETIGAASMKRAVAWLADHAGEESTRLFRFQQWIHGIHGDSSVGWPWYPGAAAWVTPTSISILAFEHAVARREDKGLRERVSLAREFLVNHICVDGGWNYGYAHSLGQDLNSYPETTGVGLAALRPIAGEKQPDAIGNAKAIERAKQAAHRHFATCKTAEGLAWLRIGLRAHGEAPAARFDLTSPPVPRTTLDAALTTIALAPHNPLLS